MPKYDCTLSVVLPAYNEEENLRLNLPLLVAAFEPLVRGFEIIIVDDGSTDATADVVRSFAASDPRFRLIQHETNRGPGSGVVTGVPYARNEFVIFLPADIAVRLDQLDRFFEKMSGADVVVGVSSDRPDYTLFRKLASRVYILFIKALFRLPQRQFNYVHLYRGEVLRKCPPTVSGVFISVEILVKARDAGFRIAEVDVEYVPRECGQASCGKTSVILDTIRDALRFYRVRKRARSGS